MDIVSRSADLDNLPDPDELALEIVENSEAGLESFKAMVAALRLTNEWECHLDIIILNLFKCFFNFINFHFTGHWVVSRYRRSDCHRVSVDSCSTCR